MIEHNTENNDRANYTLNSGWFLFHCLLDLRRKMKNPPTPNEEEWIIISFKIIYYHSQRVVTTISSIFLRWNSFTSKTVIIIFADLVPGENGLRLKILFLVLFSCQMICPTTDPSLLFYVFFFNKSNTSFGSIVHFLSFPYSVYKLQIYLYVHCSEIMRYLHK